jgi:VWFA-related protein
LQFSLRVPRTSAALVAAFVSALELSQTQERPVFRAGVEIVVTDVVVLTKDGNPVRDLDVADFLITAGGKPRAVKSATFIEGRPTSATTRAPLRSTGVPGPTVNSREAGGRTIVFVVDVENIRAGEGRRGTQAIGEYLDRLNPNDYVGFVALPYGIPRVDLTTNRALIREAASRVTGSSNVDRTGEMSVGEATYIARRDVKVLADYLKRDEVTLTPEVIAGQQQVAERALDRHRARTRILLDSLRAIAEAMAEVDGPKAIVLVSEGLFADRGSIDDLKAFADATERSRVTMYALQLDAPVIEAAYGNVTSSRRVLDRDVGFDGLASAAVLTRGAAFRGDPGTALGQIAAESSGYYLLAFERNPTDRTGSRIPISVEVRRGGVIVRGRSEFTPDSAESVRSPAAPVRDPRHVIGQLLRWPLTVDEIPIAVDTYAVPVSESPTDVLTIIAARVEPGGRPIAAVGWEVADSAGKPRSDAYEPKPTTTPLSAEGALYLAPLRLASGRYRLKLGAIATDGRRGSVEHTFDVRPWPPGAIRMGDLLIAEGTGVPFYPSPRPGLHADTISVRADLYAATAAAFDSARARLQVRAAESAAIILDAPLSWEGTGNPLKRTVESGIRIDRLPTGAYVISIIMETPTGILQRERLLQK